MLNLLVIEEDIKYAKELVNAILQNNLNIRLHAIASTQEEGIEIIKKQDIDIILLDIYKQEKDDLLLEYIKERNYEKYKESIILISHKQKIRVSLIDMPFFCGYLEKPFEMKKLVSIVKEISTTKEKGREELMIRQKITKELAFLQFNFTYMGTQYLIDTILTLFKRKNYYGDNLKNDIYPIIAEKYGKNINNIKCDILTATNNMYYDCESDKIHKYFYTKEKPKPKMIIYTILNKL